MFGKKNKKSEGHSEKAATAVAFRKGNTLTRLSAAVWGLGNLVNGQIIKGLIMLGIEIGFLAYMVSFGIGAIGDMITLGTVQQQEYWDEAEMIYKYKTGDDSMLCLLYGVITIFVILGAVVILTTSVRSAYAAQQKKEQGKPMPTFLEDLRMLKHEKLHDLLLFPPVAGIICFTVIPLVFMILIAFTNYDHEHQTPGNLFDWVGLANFKEIFSTTGKLSNAFWPVFRWTLIWAVLATVTTYILGMILAIVINRKDTKFKGFWRFTFVLSIAVPQFVSLLVMRTIFNTNGAANILLRQLGIIGSRCRTVLYGRRTCQSHDYPDQYLDRRSVLAPDHDRYSSEYPGGSV